MGLRVKIASHFEYFDFSSDALADLSVKYLVISTVVTWVAPKTNPA